jgi:hypothetical protein
MAVNYHADVKTARMQAVADAIDAGAGAGTLEVCSAAFAAVLVTYTLSDPAATVTDDVLTLAGLPKNANASADGTAAVARIKDSDGTVVVNNLTVGTVGTDVIVSNTTINNGAPYSLTGGSLTHAA